MSTSSEYSTIYSIPSVSTYHRIRTGSGLTPFSTEAATRGLPNSLFAVQVMHNDEAIGMGRVIGDGGLFFQVTDIGVLPRYQGQGLGKKIMAEIHQWLKNNVPKEGPYLHHWSIYTISDLAEALEAAILQMIGYFLSEKRGKNGRSCAIPNLDD
ncbi:MAG: hypothetical protein LQ342_006190 [Letrouitia transgressa]|nr:MAG: hypothetical protein LQ342_006190 [Letrouitia transgressa]